MLTLFSGQEFRRAVAVILQADLTWHCLVFPDWLVREGSRWSACGNWVHSNWAQRENWAWNSTGWAFAGSQSLCKVCFWIWKLYLPDNGMGSVLLTQLWKVLRLLWIWCWLTTEGWTENHLLLVSRCSINAKNWTDLNRLWHCSYI